MQSSSPAEKLCQQGENFLKEKKIDDATKTFDEALKKDPNHTPSRIGKSKVYLALANERITNKDLTGAKSYLKQAYNIAPENTEANEKLASIRREQYLEETKETPKASTNSFSSSPSSLFSSSSKKNENEIENLILQGGGIKGLAYLKALEELSKHVPIASIKRVGGTSAGAITATLLGVGYSLNELSILVDLPFNEFMDGPFSDDFLKLVENKEDIKKLGKTISQGSQQVKNAKGSFGTSSEISLLGSNVIKANFDPNVKGIKKGLSLLTTKENNFGLFPGEYFLEWLEEKLQSKTGIPHVTFAELQKLKKDSKEFSDIKDIYLIGSNITAGKTEIFSHETTPDMIVSDAVRISMSIPLIFSPHHKYIKKNGQRVLAEGKNLYVDGGLLDNYALWLFDEERYGSSNSLSSTRLENSRTLGLRLVSSARKNQCEGNTALETKEEQPESLGAYLFQIVNTVLNKQHSDHLKNHEQARTIYIDHADIDTLKFNLTKDEIKKLSENGKKAVSDYFNNRLKQEKDSTLQVNIINTSSTSSLESTSSSSNSSQASSLAKSMSVKQ